MAKVKRAREGVAVSFDEAEADVLRNLGREMRLLLEGDIPEGDPVVERLFPQAYEGAEDERKYRELIGSELEDHKRRALATFEEHLGHVGAVDRVLSAEDSETWLTVLNDIRLAIGVRIDINEGRMTREIDPEDADAPALSAIHWLAWIQERLLKVRR